MTSKVKPNAPYRLIVEGRDDLYAITNLTARHGWNWDTPAPHVPYIDNAEGVEKALEALRPAARTYKRVGIVLDADLSSSDRWASVRDRLTAEGVTLPEDPDPDGTVVQLGDRRVGVWLMPNNANPGKLEDFLGNLVPVGDAPWEWSDEATAKAKTLGAPFSDADFIKARIHSWLAWQQEPGQPFGTAITVGAFAHDADLATRFVAWMTRLFV